MAADLISNHLRAIVENLRENRPVAGFVEVVTKEIHTLSLKENVHKLSTSEWAGEQNLNPNVYVVVDQLERISADPRNAIEHAALALRYWENAEQTYSRHRRNQ
jgi:hypothetical protein